MSDRFAACIRIGGQLSFTRQLLPDDPGDGTTVLQGLLGALHDDSASHEYGEAVIPAACVVLDLYLEKGILVFKNAEACNGEFEATEEFCVEHDIPFNRWSDCCWPYNGENVYWRPGMSRPVTTLADSSGDEIVCGKTVREALAKLDHFLSSENAFGRQITEALGRSSSLTVKPEVGKLIEEATRLLHDACPKLPDDLPKFEMIA